MAGTYIPLIKRTKWVDLSNEHKKLRETVESDLKEGCNKGNIQPIMLQGAFGIGKSTTLYYLFHYGWEVLKTPTFYMPLAKIVDAVKKEAESLESGKVQNNQLSRIINSIIKEQIDKLRNSNWNDINDIDFPDFKSGDDSENPSLNQYLEDFIPVTLDSNDTKESEISKLVFSEEVIRQALESTTPPILLVDEFESKFYELKRYVESSGGGILRELFDQVVQTKPFLLVIGNGPASGYEVAKEKGTDGNNDSETAANRRLKTIQIPFPTVALLKRKFMKECANGYVNFIWWMSRCRPGHIQKLWDAIDYSIYKEYDATEFLVKDIFNEPIDESGEEVKYLKVSYFNQMNSYIRPIVGRLLLDFEPQSIKIEDSYREAMKDSAEDFFCTDELVSVVKELNPAISDDFSAYLEKCKEQGKYTSVDYIRNVGKYFSYILSACSNSDGKIAFSTACRNNKEKALATTFLIPLLELTYDFISQYEDNEDQVTRETKDFILDSIKFIESSVEEETIDDNFENLNSIFETCKIKSGNEIYMQYSLRAIKEIIEQPIGSPKLKYKDMSLDKKLESSNFRQSVLLTSRSSDNTIIFVPILEDEPLKKYILRLKDYIKSQKNDLHTNASKTIRIVYLQEHEYISQLKEEVCKDGSGNLLPICKMKKLVFEDYNHYQFKFGGHIADFIDSVAKIVIVAGSCNDIVLIDDNRTYDFHTAIDVIKNREWTKQKEAIRTIEHYSRLVLEGDSCVINTISLAQKKDHESAMENLICEKRDYEDNILWDFTSLESADITDTKSKYLAMYYILENAKKPTSSYQSLLKILQEVGNFRNALYLPPIEDSINESLFFDQILNILSRETASKLMSSYDNEDYIIKHLCSFTAMMNNERSVSKLDELLTFMKDSLNDHWIASYNNDMSYGFSKGRTLIKLLYLKAYIEKIDFSLLRSQLNTRIEEKQTELVSTISNSTQHIAAITDLLYSKNYAKANPEKMPFQGYVSELQLVSRLLSNCKRIVLEDKDGISIFAIISSIVWRISNIVSQAKVVERQINGILISLKNKKELIEKEYQLPINTIYQDSLTSKLINLSDLKPNGQPQRYDGDWCWTQYARYLTPRSEVQNVIDAKLHPAKETSIDESDIHKFKALLQTSLTNSTYKVRMDETLKFCRDCQAEALSYTKVYEYIKDLLKE